MAQLIRASTCRTCKFSELLGARPDGGLQLQCRRNPPIGGPLLTPVKPGVVAVQFHAGFPGVEPDMWCGEHKPRISVAENAFSGQKVAAA